MYYFHIDALNNIYFMKILYSIQYFNMLSTTDIVFAINKVPDIRPPLHSTVYFIANLQADNLPGSHWVAVRRLYNQGYYFDLFGRLPPMEIMAWLTANCSSWTYNLQC